MQSESSIPAFWFYLSLFMSQAMVAANIVGSKYLLQFLSPWYILFVRFAVATFFLSVVWAGTKRFGSKPRVLRVRMRDLTKTDWTYIAVQALTVGLLFNSLMYCGLHYTSANVAGIITSTLPALIALFSMIFLGERLTVFTALCILFAVLGLMVINARHFAEVDSGKLFGDALVLLAMIPEAMYYVLSKMHHNRLPLFVIAVIMNGINLIAVTGLLLLLGHVWPAHLDGFQFFLLTMIGLSTGLFFVFWYFGSQGVTGSAAGLFTAAMPIVTMLLAAIFLGERVTWLQAAGMLLVLLSIGFNVARIKIKREELLNK